MVTPELKGYVPLKLTPKEDTICPILIARLPMSPCVKECGWAVKAEGTEIWQCAMQIIAKFVIYVDNSQGFSTSAASVNYNV